MFYNNNVKNYNDELLLHKNMDARHICLTEGLELE